MVGSTTSPRGRPGPRPAPGGRSSARVVAVAVASGLAAIGGLRLVDPAHHLGLDPASTLGFAASLGAALLLFGTAFAILAPAVDLVAAWERATPDSQRRSSPSDGGTGGTDGACFFGSGDGDCGGDGGGGGTGGTDGACFFGSGDGDCGGDGGGGGD